MAVFTNFEAQHEVDKEIAHYKAIICGLLTTRNTFAAISKLPPEIMSEIFMASNIGKQGVTRSLLSISSVCTQWRQICLDTPQLWATLSLAQPRWFYESLNRAKSAPLTVYIPRYDRLDTDFRQMASTLVSETHRFKEVGILYSSTTLYDILSSFLCRQPGLRAPLLQKLCVRMGAVADELSPRILENFWTELDSLQSLKLVGVLPRTPSLMPVLTHLYVHAQEEGRHLSVGWLINLLRNTPLVESIDISMVSSGPVIRAPKLLQIPLPNLRHMTLVLKGLREATLFSCLEIPHSILGHIEFRNKDIPDEAEADVTHLHDFVSTRIPYDASSLNVTRESSDGRLKLQVTDAGTQPILVNLSMWRLPLAQQHVNLVASLPLEKIHQVILKGRMGDNEALAWSNLLPFLVHIRVIHVQRVTVLQSLAGKHLSSSSTRIEEFSNLELGSIDIFSDALSTQQDWAHFEAACEARRRHGNPIRMLRISCCDIPAGYANKLMRRVNTHRRGKRSKFP